MNKVTQHEPVWLDLQATVEKTVEIIKEAAAEGAKLVTFPECWVPGYPAWVRNVTRQEDDRFLLTADSLP